MQGKKQFRNLLFHIISRAATAALAIAVVFALTVVLTPSAQAQTPATSAVWTEKVLHSFDLSGGGVNPEAGLIFDAAGNLYGTTTVSGTYGQGTAFELTPAAGGGWTEKVLYNFGSNGADGSGPYAGLIFDGAGNLYGTTYEGGTYGWGTAFELTPSVGGGWTEQVLYSFCSQTNCTDGSYPFAGLIFDAAGNLYGTTARGGTSSGCSGSGCGTVFELTPTAGGGWTEQVLYSFCSQTNCTDGSYPFAGLIFDAAGNLYGTTFAGGIHPSCTLSGYAGCGTVFELSPREGGGWTETVLYSFGSGTDGGYPVAGLIFDAAGNLYGTTADGAYSSSCGQICGTVFELTPTADGGWTEQVLYSFCSQTNCTDGYGPYAGLIFDAAGNLYGTTIYGGIYGYGTVFELTPTAGGGWTETALHSFGNDPAARVEDGAGPFAGLIFDAAGNLYGTTYGGGNGTTCGPSGCGTVFEMTPIYPCATCSHGVFR
ncbi:MAG: choice-of-anchor tandem repeat GloVer-containing protein [Candidatus Korobacteraceae bacterium]|jgi:uncharacterized repeat protein (TIGR03803 family)